MKILSIIAAISLLFGCKQPKSKFKKLDEISSSAQVGKQNNPNQPTASISLHGSAKQLFDTLMDDLKNQDKLNLSAELLPPDQIAGFERSLHSKLGSMKVQDQENFDKVLPQFIYFVEKELISTNQESAPNLRKVLVGSIIKTSNYSVQPTKSINLMWKSALNKSNSEKSQQYLESTFSQLHLMPTLNQHTVDRLTNIFVESQVSKDVLTNKSEKLSPITVNFLNALQETKLSNKASESEGTIEQASQLYLKKTAELVLNSTTKAEKSITLLEVLEQASQKSKAYATDGRDEQKINATLKNVAQRFIDRNSKGSIPLLLNSKLGSFFGISDSSTKKSKHSNELVIPPPSTPKTKPIEPTEEATPHSPRVHPGVLEPTDKSSCEVTERHKWIEETCVALDTLKTLELCHAFLGKVIFVENKCIPLDILKYAPLFYFHPEEEYFPGSVETFLENSVLVNSGSTYFRALPEDASPLETRPFFKGIKPSLTEKPPIYTIIVPLSENRVDVYFWLFYPYNKGKTVKSKFAGITIFDETFGSHVGDWEHVGIRFKNGIPFKLKVSTHNLRKDLDWSELNFYEDTHPKVYIAEGSHGSWATPGTHIYQTIDLKVTNIKLKDETVEDPKMMFESWHSLDMFYFDATVPIFGKYEYMNFSGAWGDLKSGCTIEEIPCTRSNGPTWKWRNTISSAPIYSE